MQHLAGTETGAVPDSESLQGALAEVIVAIDEATSGKIAVQGDDRTVQLVARVHAGAERRRFGVGDEVIIVELDGATARIAGPKFLA